MHNKSSLNVHKVDLFDNLRLLVYTVKKIDGLLIIFFFEKQKEFN